MGYGSLHVTKLEEFAAWCEAMGWRRVDTQATMEILRLVKPGASPVLVYWRDLNPRAEHYRVNSAGQRVVDEWLEARRFHGRRK